MSVFLPSLKASGHLDQVKMTIFNVGSRKLSQEDDYGSLSWGIFAPNLSIYGFDADEDACNQANADLENRKINWQEVHVPIGLSNTVGESTLYVTKNPMCSSLYPPNESLISRFVQLADVVRLDFTVDIETTTLDDFCREEGIEDVDFLQIDVQGAELLVLEGAQSLLQRSVLGLQAEVEFSPIYLNQPLFADIDTFLRNQEFDLFDLYMARRVRLRSPLQSSTHPGQLLWGEAFYFRDLLSLSQDNSRKTPEKIFKLACVADALKFTDYALELLEYLTINYGSNPQYNFAHNILESLGQFPDLLKQGLESLPVVKNLQKYL